VIEKNKGDYYMLDKEQFRKAEGRLYRYYKQLKLIEKLKNTSIVLYKQIKQIEEDMSETNVKIDYIQSGMAVGEKVQSSSSGTSYAEREIERAIEQLEKELVYKKRKILKLRARIRGMEEEISDMEYNISMLSEENKRFLEYKYSEKMNPTEIAEKMNMATATAYRKREELVEDIAQWCNVIN
jgi:chromosome segregation ATPase